LPPLPLVLYEPREELSTSVVYSRLDQLRAGRQQSAVLSAKAHSERARGERAEWAAVSGLWRQGRLGLEEAPKRVGPLLKNDLEAASFSLLPVLAERRTALVGEGALAVLMSGSGPTIFGLFPSAEAAAAAASRLTAGGHPARTATACPAQVAPAPLG
jgi:4-diphosphocytidyl-2C-methyl-D-erythritol kinase